MFFWKGGIFNGVTPRGRQLRVVTMLGHALLKGVAKWMLYIKFHYKLFDQGVASIWQPMQNKLSLESTSCCSQSEVLLPDLEGVKELDLHQATLS